MNKVTVGKWTVTDGKTNRHYIYCDNSNIETGRCFMHPDHIDKTNGLGMYGHEHLQDLAIAILLFERKKGRGCDLKNKFEYINK